MSIVVNTDFTGEYKVAKTCYDQLDFYIAKYERMYLIQLLGADFYDAFIADLTVSDPQVPQTVEYLTIFNEFHADESTCVYSSEGIRKMLTQFIYFHYVREGQVENTPNGTVRNNVELGTNASFKGNIVQAYNEGVNNAHSIQWYICDNSSDYPLENVQPFEFTSGI